MEVQRLWATHQGLALTSSGNAFANTSDALFARRLRDDTRRELEDGKGGEIAKLPSLRSSSCLVVNVFEAWRDSPAPVAAALGGASTHVTFEGFESKQPTGISEPHLDVLMKADDLAIAVEGKFCEPYDRGEKNIIQLSYLNTPGIWSGMPWVRAFAERIHYGTERFEWLAVHQLLKHIAGLAVHHERFRLVLCWYRIDGRIADQVEAEIGRFARAVSSEVDFFSITYQELMTSLRNYPEPAPGYFDYLEGRYGLGAVARPRLPLLDLSMFGAASDAAFDRESVPGTEGVVFAYHRSVAAAPHRHHVDKEFFVDSHDGAGGGKFSIAAEAVRAKALFNLGRPLRVSGESVRILDYQVPLQTAEIDEGIGDIDLVGVDEDGRPWIIELKVLGGDRPLSALLQALRYSAIVDANRGHFATELTTLFGTTPKWPAVVAVAAPRDYWDRHRRSRHPRLEAIRELAEGVAPALGIRVVVLQLDAFDAEWSGDRPRLLAEPTIEVLADIDGTATF